MTKNHVKPTSEELEAQTKTAIEEAERLAKDPPKEEENITPPVDDVVETPVETPELVEDKEEPTKETATPSEEDKEKLKKKLSASARENQKIYAKNRVINQAIVEAEEMPEPTEEELAKEFKDWDELAESDKELRKEIAISKRWRTKIKEASNQASKIEKWNDSVDEFIEDPKTYIAHPDLEGKANAFREFASQEANNSVPFNILIPAFLYQQSTGRKPNKGAMFETGSGGPNSKPQPKNDKLTLEEGRKLRETNYNKWKEYSAAGKIQLDL